jgi:hypothetical protein
MLALVCLALIAPQAWLRHTGTPYGGFAWPHPSAPLRSAALAETRTTWTLQPGVTLTRTARGHTDPSAVWTIEVAPYRISSHECHGAVRPEGLVKPMQRTPGSM